jgi:hypothetical protein
MKRVSFAGRRAAGAVLLLAGAVCLYGCSGSEGPAPDDQPAQGQTEKKPRDFLDAANRMLRQERSADFRAQFDMARTRDAVENLNGYLKALKDEQQKAPFDVDVKKLGRWQKELALTKDEAAELASPAFTLLDANYLELCFQLGDVARSLDLEALPALHRARLAFEWVVRQVNLKDRVRQGQQDKEDGLYPPQFVLQLGHGTANERALVFLALLRQLGIDGCMVAYRDGDGRAVPWLPGVLIPRAEQRRAGRTEPGIYLFDTRLGAPLPGPGGKGIARLDEVSKAPDLLRPILGDADAREAVPRRVARAEVLLPVPLSALSPRMKFLQMRVKAHTKVSLALDPDALRKRFAAAQPAPVRFWSDPKDPNTPTRVLRAFLPAGQGGVDRANRLGHARGLLIPWSIVQGYYPAALRPSLYGELTGRLAHQFELYSLAPRNSISRGRLDQAVKPLSTCLDHLREQRGLVQDATRDEERRKELEQEIRDWCKKLAEIQLEVATLTEQDRAAGGKDAEAKQGLAQAQNARVNLWKQNPQLVTIIFYRAMAETLGKDAMYLLCLCMQEKAERYQTRVDRMEASGRTAGGPELARAKRDALQAWKNAQGWWQKYATEYGLAAEAFPQRVAEVGTAEGRGLRDLAAGLYEALALDVSRGHAARLMQARALEKSGQRDRAVELVQKDVHDLEGLLDGTAMDRLRTFLRTHRAFATGSRPYTGPETFTWLRRAAALRLKQLEGPP